MRWWRTGVALLLAGCGGHRFIAEERWGGTTPDIRAAVVLSTPPQVVFLAGSAPVEVALDKILAPGASSVRIWMFGYSLETLAAVFPGLRGKTAAEVVRGLTLTLGGAGNPAPPADVILAADVDKNGPTEVPYVEKTWADWQAAMAGTLTLNAPPDLACAGTSVERLQGPAGITLSGIVETEQGHVMLAGHAANGRLSLFRIDGTDVVQVATSTLTGPIRDRMAWDDMSGSGYLLTRDGVILHFGPNGERMPVPRVPVIDAGRQSRGVVAIAAGEDGTVMAASYYLFALRNGRWEGIQFTLDQMRPIDLLRVANAERVFFFNACWINSVSGTSARLVFPDIMCGQTGIRTINALDVDPEGAITAGDRGRISILGPTGATFEESGNVGAADIEVALALRGGRHLVGGDGLLALWFGKDWCRLSTDATLKLRFGAASRNGQTAYVVAEGSPNPILRLRLPPRQ